MSILNEHQLKNLSSVIGELEHKTSGEIRLMIVKRSSVTGHVPMLLWSLLISISFLLLWFWRHEFDLLFWNHWWVSPAVLVASYFLAIVLARFGWVQRRFTSFNDLKHQVWARAEVEFHREGLGGTSARTGILIFVSLMEHQAVVIADHGIASKVPANTWDEVVAIIIEGAKTGHWEEKLEQALRQCGALLATHFPAHVVNANELSNVVIIKD